MSPPKLLVSVRSPDEAINAVRGGAAIVDVKDPATGPLGMASFATIRSIAATLQTVPQPPPLSLALGELKDWFPHGDHAALPAAKARQSLTRLLNDLPNLRFLKCGLSGCRPDRHWTQSWDQLRQAAPPAIAWVAVAYADADRAAAPDIPNVLDAAIHAKAKAVLIDTFVKDGHRLLDWLSPDQLTNFARQCRQHQILLALAGQVSPPDFAILRQAGADVVAVRGAACEDSDRLQTVSEHRVRSLVNALDQIT